MIKDLEELANFLKICRKQGVNEIKFAGVSVCFGDLLKKSKAGQDSEAQEEKEIPTDGPTDEELMFFSAGGPVNENN